jgi:hypothetical protein
MKIFYENAIYCIRTLAAISERLYLERDLKTMTQLHSKLANNKNVNCTPTGLFYQDFNAIFNPQILHQKPAWLIDDHLLAFLELDDISVDMTKSIRKEEESPEMLIQRKLDMRRYDLIANDFWGHQARRKNGDMTVGEMILPWVEVPNK